MIVFELSMPSKASWNGKWGGDGRPHVRVYHESSVPKSLVGNDFFYTWDDGWTACVSVRKVDCKEGRKLKKTSVGFCGYDWMIKSIIDKGRIEKRNLNE